MTAFLCSHLGAALGVDTEEIDTDAHFVTLGMDSLMATDLRARLQSALGIAIPSTALIYDYPDVRSLSAGLLDLWLEARSNPDAKSSVEAELLPSNGAVSLSLAQE